MGVNVLLKKVINYFRIREGESMGGRLIAFGWGDKRTLIKVRINFPVCLYHFYRWDNESSGLLNGLYVFRIGCSFRIRDKKFFPKGTNLMVWHFNCGWLPWRNKCRYLSLELLEDSGLTELGQHLCRVKPWEIWNKYYTTLPIKHEVVAQ